MDWQSVLDSAGIFATKFLVLVAITGFAAVVVYGIEVASDRIRGNRRQKT
ncbi:MAG TPA: hypothetical protein VL966_00765 [Alphaproteobacteria bacterium]|jgi:hypothetical protein|nr:hypothetical protein [Alphaproteobacteria bacterium]